MLARQLPSGFFTQFEELSMELIVLSIVGSVALLVMHLLDISLAGRPVQGDVAVPSRLRRGEPSGATMTLTMPA